MSWKRIASFTIPLLGTTLHPNFKKVEARHVQDMISKTDHMAVIKPWRQLGAPWIDNFVTRRKNFVLCESCTRKYDINWYRRYEYISDWVGWLTDCDGCRERTRCNMYYPEETVKQVLNKRFWLKTKT